MKLYAWAVLVGGLGGGLLAGDGLGQAIPPPPVAVPILQGTGEALTDLELTCSTGSASPCAYYAYWDGKVLNTDREAASGVYIYQLIVDGRRFTKKMIVMK